MLWTLNTCELDVMVKQELATACEGSLQHLHTMQIAWVMLLRLGIVADPGAHVLWSLLT